MSSFDVRVFAIRRRPSRSAFEVRWRVADRDRSRSFITRALADSYRAELVRVARQGQAFDPVTGEPATWVTPEPVTVTWYQHAVAYTEMKWPRLASHSRASLADALATVTRCWPGNPAAGRQATRCALPLNQPQHQAAERPSVAPVRGRPRKADGYTHRHNRSHRPRPWRFRASSVRLPGPVQPRTPSALCVRGHPQQPMLGPLDSAGKRPAAPWAGPSSSSSGTC
jgi:hypothetical protein